MKPTRKLARRCWALYSERYRAYSPLPGTEPDLFADRPAASLGFKPVRVRLVPERKR
jgi:hypothetical protein